MRSSGEPSTRIWWLVAGALFLALCLRTASLKSAATDEVHYIGAGLAILEHGDARMTPEHPPLVKVLAALPVWLVARPSMRVEGPGFRLNPWFEAVQGAWGSYLLYYTDDVDPMRRLFLARLPMILIGLLGGVFAGLLARELDPRSGPVPPLTAACFLWFYPEYQGHASIATMDVPLAVGMLTITWASLRWWRQPSLNRALALAAAGSVATLIKLPATVFLAATLLALAALIPFSGGRVRWRHWLVIMAATVLAAWIIAWAGNGFRFGYVPAGAEISIKRPMIPPLEDSSARAMAINWAWSLHLLPETTLATFAHLSSFENKSFHLFGHESKEGFYLYFLVTILLKTPLLMLACVAVAAGAWARRLRWRSAAHAWRMQLTLLLLAPPLALLLMHIVFRVNLGHRYILFIYPPLCALVGVTIGRWWSAGGRPRAAVGAVVVLHALTALWSFPHGATYFNVLAGSPVRASRYLGDSNVDWGQDVAALGKYLEREAFESVNLALFGLNPPEAFGISDYRWINPDDTLPPHTQPILPPNPAHPTAISAHHLPAMRRRHPGAFDGEQLFVLNSIAVFPPQTR